MYNETRREDVRHVLVAALCVRRAVRRARRMFTEVSSGSTSFGAHADDGERAAHSYVITAFGIHGLGRPYC